MTRLPAEDYLRIAQETTVRHLDVCASEYVSVWMYLMLICMCRFILLYVYLFGHK